MWVVGEVKSIVLTKIYFMRVARQKTDQGGTIIAICICYTMTLLVPTAMQNCCD